MPRATCISACPTIAAATSLPVSYTHLPYESAPTKADSRASTAFVSKFSPDGSSLVYSTYPGGTNQDEGNAIALDTNKEAYVTGWTSSGDFPVTAGTYQALCAPEPVNTSQGIAPGNSCGLWGDYSAFVTKLNSTGTALIYSTFLGGVDGTSANAIACLLYTSRCV